MKPEFSRRLPVDRIPPQGLEERIEASEEERQALAQRFGLPAIHSLKARFEARPWSAGGVELKGALDARVEQVCVVTLESFETDVREAVERYYLAGRSGGRHPTVLTLESLEDEEPETIEGGAIDLGELSAEILGLALEPYPRKPGVVFEDARESSAAAPRAFDALERLRKQ